MHVIRFVSSFSFHPIIQRQRKNIGKNLYSSYTLLGIKKQSSFLFSKSSSSSSSDDESIAMEILILNLAEETTDESRRKKLDSIFVEKVENQSKPEAKQFAKLFDSTIMRMGEEVQARARKKAMEMNDEMKNIKKQNSKQGTIEGEDGIISEKSKEEQKLWAYIDMMVQSKSLSKKLLG